MTQLKRLYGPVFKTSSAQWKYSQIVIHETQWREKTLRDEFKNPPKTMSVLLSLRPEGTHVLLNNPRVLLSTGRSGTHFRSCKRVEKPLV